MFTNSVFKASTAVHFRCVCPVPDEKRQLHVHDNMSTVSSKAACPSPLLLWLVWGDMNHPCLRSSPSIPAASACGNRRGVCTIKSTPHGRVSSTCQRG